MLQKPMVRQKQKRRRTKQLAEWRAKNEAEQTPQAKAKSEPAKK